MSAEVIYDMPFEDYLAHPALSASGMKRLLDSPARFQWDREHPTETAAMIHGRLIHAVAFGQPHNATVKDWDGRTKEGKERAAEIESLGLDIVSADEWDVAEGIATALKANERVADVLYGRGVRHEVSAFWTDPETGVELKCRFDSLQANGDIGDLKSTTGAHPDVFIKDAAKYGYFTSAAHYRDGSIAVGLSHDPTFTLVAVEKKAPHFISVVGINDYDLQLAELLRRKAIRTYAECVERDQWPDYTREVAYPDAPAWWRIQAEQATGLYEIEVPA